MSSALLIATLAGMAAAALAADGALRRYRQTRARQRTLELKKKAQADRVRRLAGESLAAKRHRRQLELAAQESRTEVERLEAALQEALRRENRLVVLDERRMPGDQPWLVVVQSPPVGAPWSGQRRFRVWGVDAEVARAKAVRRYPVAEGYGVVTIEPLSTPGRARATIGQAAG